MKHTQILSAAAALLVVATAAQAQHRQDDHHDRQDQRGQAPPQVQAQQRQDDHHDRQDQRGQFSPQIQSRQHDGNPGRGDADAQRREIEQARAGQARAQEMENQRRVAQYGEQQRELQMRQREQAGEVERARQLDERDRLIEAQRRAEVNRVYVPDRDYRPGYEYRYRIGGVYRETDQYGVDILRQAVSLGYQRGYAAGEFDFRDRLPADYRRAYDYQTGNYGFTSNDIPESDYTYYFREGFQRGYDDAYWNRARYGTFSNGTASILGDVLAGILGLTSIR